MGANGGNGSPVYPTLVRPPPVDPERSPIENVLDVTELSVLGPDIFTNTRPPWHPPGARGIFGGAVIGLCLAAGQRTVPDSFVVHSCHCYFLLAGSGEVPILLHVERVRDGRSFATRTVQARQKGKCIFTTTISFCKEQESQGKQTPVVRHAAKLPLDAGPPPPDDWDGDKELFLEEGPYKQLGFQEGPFQTFRTTVTNPDSEIVSERKTRQWVRTKGKISARGGLPAHVNALAYVSDSYFIGTITRIHRLWRFPVPVEELDKLDKTVAGHLKALHDYEGGGDIASYAGRPQVGMMVSLDHTIYFHEPRRIKADEWMFLEKESPWSGDGRGVVTQRIFAKDGTLLATCYQEGLVRLKPGVIPEANDGDAKPKL